MARRPARPSVSTGWMETSVLLIHLCFFLQSPRASDFNHPGGSTMFLTLPHSLHCIVRSVRTGRRPTNRRHAYRPRLLVLEDRVVLSTLTVTSSADDVTQNHTLRYAVANAQS